MTTQAVLLVDDELPILTLVGDALEDEGYAVSRARSGVEAIAKLKLGESFDLIVSDVSMPDGISGVDLAHAARALNPQAKIILVSGHPKAQLEAFPPDVAYLPKPYRLAQLLGAIEQLS